MWPLMRRGAATTGKTGPNEIDMVAASIPPGDDWREGRQVPGEAPANLSRLAKALTKSAPPTQVEREGVTPGGCVSRCSRMMRPTGCASACRIRRTDPMLLKSVPAKSQKVSRPKNKNAGKPNQTAKTKGRRNQNIPRAGPRARAGRPTRRCDILNSAVRCTAERGSMTSHAFSGARLRDTRPLCRQLSQRHNTSPR